ncbi:hypothetical protein K488DRAFT_52287 [Vararia minispora EC-137]|uniref:Uncharacterized protein n=1 Tax=Vararia minispora EC-137 TaxID=1314806 RepID=A0ACB8QHP7_9AGAM|nr:hypothetical protein K488DRAFT_52287 [Vararia minispora EC-137]
MDSGFVDPDTIPTQVSDNPEPHPYIHEPLLYISNLPSFVTDTNLARAFQHCAPFRPLIKREGANKPCSGTIEFKFLDRAEKALATLNGRPIPETNPPVLLVLSPYPHTNPPTPLPPPSASPRIVKHLPDSYTDFQLFDLFRPFGALASTRMNALGRGLALIEFWREEDARHAEETMHCADIEGQNIAVQLYQQRRAPSGAQMEFSANAPVFVPQNTTMFHSSAHGASFPPPQQPGRPSPTSPRQRPFLHGPGQQVQLAPLHGPGSNSHSGLIDPCNLFCKNLDPSIDSNSLFTHFRPRRRVDSARVMRNEGGESRGFGFVSFQTPDQAAAALHSMNGAVVGNKQLVVRLHEPKQLRQEKLAQRFGGHNGHPRSASGATSPTQSEAGDSLAGWSPGVRSVSLGSPVGHHERLERPRRGSGSYYNAALTGTLNMPMRYDDLSALSPVVRKEVLTGELSRRLRTMGTVNTNEVDGLVDALVGLSLSEVVSAMQDSAKLEEQIERARRNLSPNANLAPSRSSSRPPASSPSPANSQDSRLINPNVLDATASAPEHPSTPISVSPALSTPPRTSSPAPSIAPSAASERERILAAVTRLEPTQASELTDLLMSLPKRERAMCLFNVEVLRAKIQDAKAVLDVEDDEPAPTPAPVIPQTPVKRSTAPAASPSTPDLSSRGPSAAASPTPATPGATHTVESLASMEPPSKVLRLAREPGSGLAKADPLVVKASDEWFDSLLSKAIPDRKQAVGAKIHKLIKAQGLKGTAKLTVRLLEVPNGDDELRALVHLIESYPSIIKERALQKQRELGIAQ